MQKNKERKEIYSHFEAQFSKMILVCVAKQTISANSPEPYCGTSVIIVDSNAIQ